VAQGVGPELKTQYWYIFFPSSSSSSRDFQCICLRVKTGRCTESLLKKQSDTQIPFLPPVLDMDCPSSIPKKMGVSALPKQLNKRGLYDCTVNSK
jgi:hypothetical protein